MLADGTRIVEVNNKIVSIGGTYNDPEIYSVLLINAENETYAEYIKGDVFDEIKCRKCNNVGMLEEIFRTVEFVQGKEDARFYNSFDYRYKKGAKGFRREQRYQAILAVTDIIKKATSEEQVMKMLKEKYPQYS